MKILGTNIISSLGFTTLDNFEQVKSGASGVKYYEAGTFDLSEPFVASLIDKIKLEEHFSDMLNHSTSPQNVEAGSLTLLERASVLSVVYANGEAEVDLSSPHTLFVLSTTKGNIDAIDADYRGNGSPFLWSTARRIADFFGNPNTPIVVSNACISGAAAQVVALRYINNGLFDNVVVVGVDFLSKFIISGFQSFRALATDVCKPFDAERCGLNLGEAAATIIFGKDTDDKPAQARLICGAIRNDATHISAPSRTGEGCCRAIRNVLCGGQQTADDIAFICTHGTATPYNDAMEANAIYRAGLGSVAVNSLKSLFGHTLGAAGVLETIVSVEALGRGIVLPTLNCNNPEQLIIDNQSFLLNITNTITHTDKKYFLKTLSGFGGVNAALLFEKY